MRSSVQRLCCGILGVALLGSVAQAADQSDNPLGGASNYLRQKISAALNDVDSPEMLVQVRIAKRGTTDAPTKRLLQMLADAMKSQLGQNADKVTVLPIDTETPARVLLSQEEATELLQTHGSDIIVNGDVTLRNSAASVLVTVLTDSDRVTTKRVRVPAQVVAALAEQPEQQAVAVANPQQQQVPFAAGNGVAMGNQFGNSVAMGQGVANAGGGGFAGGAAGGFAGGSAGGGACATAMEAGCGSAEEGGEAGCDDEEDDEDEEEDEEEDEDGQTPNEAVLAFAEENMGQQVGNGECWTLAAEALKAAECEPPRFYDFGEEIGLDEVIPGDILQFKRARFEDGTGSWIQLGIPNHTAIVSEANGDEFTILHQNFGSKTVTELTINMEDMTEGCVWAFRPIEECGDESDVQGPVNPETDQESDVEGADDDPQDGPQDEAGSQGGGDGSQKSVPATE